MRKWYNDGGLIIPIIVAVPCILLGIIIIRLMGG